MNALVSVTRHAVENRSISRQLMDCFSGLAYYNTPCSKNWGASVNEARGLTAAYTVAHEMGHK